MKNTKIYIALCILIFTVGCNDKSIIQDSLSDVSWYTSIYPGSLNTIPQGKQVSFMDISQGTLTHEWTIEQGNYFLNAGFAPGIGGDTLKQFINYNIGLISKSPTVYVIFLNPGQGKVRLRDTFSKPVTYPGTRPLKAVQDSLNPNIWVIDTTFVFTVTAPPVPIN